MRAALNGGVAKRGPIKGFADLHWSLLICHVIDENLWPRLARIPLCSRQRCSRTGKGSGDPLLVASSLSKISPGVPHKS